VNLKLQQEAKPEAHVPSGVPDRVRQSFCAKQVPGVFDSVVHGLFWYRIIAKIAGIDGGRKAP